ncbi:hypothetical protein J8273_4456 [Carpediemonas membranifera]|uniref:Uncharacterized protein n=1 Tax=Carpediemonas membranifera TaxID=201153 RepID=A0A8J6ATZ6_9EUKA|nr:hypothetical protein J8273_4456 [Carpediemonas membranifera]|eukprot:KAG9394093.1 hypothetical protein J8273_4456 [Carpediemonas membranifera]
MGKKSKSVGKKAPTLKGNYSIDSEKKLCNNYFTAFVERTGKPYGKALFAVAQQSAGYHTHWHADVDAVTVFNQDAPSAAPIPMQ